MMMMRMMRMMMMMMMMLIPRRCLKKIGGHDFWEGENCLGERVLGKCQGCFREDVSFCGGLHGLLLFHISPEISYLRYHLWHSTPKHNKHFTRAWPPSTKQMSMCCITP